MVLLMGCAKCDVLRRVAEDLEHKYAEAIESLNMLHDTSDSVLCSRAKTNADDARLDYQLARFDLEAHQRQCTGSGMKHCA